MTLKVIPLLQAFSSAIRRAFVQYFTRFQLTARRAVPQRQLGFLLIIHRVPIIPARFTDQCQFLARWSIPTVNAYLPFLVRIGLLGRPWGRKTLCRIFKFDSMLAPASSVQISWARCTTTNLAFSPSNDTKSSLYSNAFCAKSLAQSTSAKNVTDKQNTPCFWVPQQRAKSEPYQTWLGDK